MSNGKKTVTETLQEDNAKLKSELKALIAKRAKETDSTEMAKMQAQIAVLVANQDRSTQLENEYTARKAKYNKNVAKKQVKVDAKRQAILDIDNEVESKPTPKPSNPPGQGSGPSVTTSDVSESGDKPSDS